MSEELGSAAALASHPFLHSTEQTGGTEERAACHRPVPDCRSRIGARAALALSERKQRPNSSYWARSEKTARHSVISSTMVWVIWRESSVMGAMAASFSSRNLRTRAA